MACTILNEQSEFRNGVIEKAAQAMSKMSITEKVELTRLPEVVLNRLINSATVTYKDEVTKVIDIDINNNRVKLANGTVVDLGTDVIYINDEEITSSELHTYYSHAKMATMPRGQMQLLAADIASDTDKMKDLGKDIAKRDGINSHIQGVLLDNLNKLADSLHDSKAQIDVWLDSKAQETGGAIAINGNTSEIRLGIGPGKQFMSGLEVFVHELYHAATDYILSSGSPVVADYRRELLAIRRKFIDSTNAADLAKHINHPDALDIAEYTLDYLSKQGTGLKEFIAYSQSNPAVMARLKEIKTTEKEEFPNLISKLTAKVREMFNVFFRKVMKEPKSDNDYQRTVFLVDRLMQAQVNALAVKKHQSMKGLTPIMDKLDSDVSKWIEKQLSKAGSKGLPALPSNASNFQRMKYLSKMLALSMVDENAKKVIRNSLSLLGFRPEGTLMMTLGDMSDNDKLADRLEYLQMQSAGIDSARQMTTVMVTEMLKEAFGGEITAEENKYLQVLVDIDAAALQGEENYEQLITDKKAALTRSNELLDELRSEFGNEYTNYYLWQAKELAEFMKTNKGNGATLLNAKAIADRVNLDVRERINAKPELVEKIDKLASLQGVLLAKDEDLVGLAQLMEDKPNGVVVLTNELEAIQMESKEHLFSDTVDKYRMIKGYLKDVYSDEIETKVAPLSKEKELAKEGFKLVKKQPTRNVTGLKTEMGYYVNSMPARQSLHKQGMRYTDKQRIGTSLTELFQVSDEAMANALATKSAVDISDRVKVLAERAKKGIFEKDEELVGLVPLLDSFGVSVDYRFTESKEDKIKYLGKEVNVAHDIGATKGAILDKRESKKHNEKIVKEIVDDAKNYANGMFGKNLHEYVMVGPNSKEPELKELWGLIPKDAKKALGDGGFFVRRDLMLGFIGYREASASNVKMVGKGLPKDIKYGIRFAEKVWKEVVTLAKSNILIRMPIVLASNVISNIVLLGMWGLSPKQTAKLQLDAVRELNVYIAAVKESIKLKGLITTGRASQAQVRAYNMAMNSLENSPIKDLMDAGFYTQIIEDIEGTASKGFLAKKINAVKNAVPKVVRDGANLAWIGKDSDFYKLMETATQYSDFVARYAAYHTFLAKGDSKELATVKVRNAFINYVKPNSKLVEYMNQMGLVMFTKYFVRVQRAIKEVAKGHPVRGIFVLLAQEYLLGDISDITDSSLLIKDFTGVFHNPIETLITAATPQGLMLAADVIR